MNELTFGENLKNLRKTANLSQQQLGDILHVTASTINGWENRGIEPRLNYIILLTKVLDVTYEELLDEENYVTNRTVHETLERKKRGNEKYYVSGTAFGERTAELLAMKNIKPSRLAENMHVPFASVEKIIKSETLNPTFQTILNVCKGLDVTIREFFNSDLFD